MCAKCCLNACAPNSQIYSTRVSLAITGAIDGKIHDFEDSVYVMSGEMDLPLLFVES